MSNQNKTAKKKKNSVRIMALILAGLMMISAATIAISLLVESGHDHDTTQSDSHAGHNH